MKRVTLPEPHRSEIVRRLAALPATEPLDPSGAVLVWVVVFALVWLAAGVALFVYLIREAPLT